MADDLDDLDALLEAPLQKEKERDDKKDGGDRDRERSAEGRKSKKKKRSRSRERSRRSRSRSKDRKHRDRKRRSRSRERGGRKSRSPRGGGGRRSRSPRDGRRRRSRTPTRGGVAVRGRRGLGGSRSRSPDIVPLTPEERDARTVFVMQLSQRVRARDVEEFFSSVGKIKDVKLIICNKTRRFKGIAYVEFRELESVPLALGLAGQKLLGVPVIVQPTQSEKNRMGNYEPPRMKEKGPMRLYVGSLHFNITEEMLRGIFEPFGTIQSIQLMMDTETRRSKGYGFITFNEADDAKKALEQLNGFELAGRPMKVGNVTERSDMSGIPPGMMGGNLDSDVTERAGVDLGASGRAALMAKLAAGTGMQVPEPAGMAVPPPLQPPPPQVPLPPMAVQQQQQLAATNPPIATQCFMLSNMFDPSQETAAGWDAEVRDDVIEECNKYGGVLHLVVDAQSASGNVYVKCPNIATAVAAVNALHGRWFAGKVITAAYVPLINYHNLFPDAISAMQLLATNR